MSSNEGWNEMATIYSNSTVLEYEDYELLEDAYYSEILGSIFRNANLYLTPLLVLYGDLTSIVALAIIIGRRMWLRHEGYVYLIALFAGNVVVLTLKYGSYAVEALFGVRQVEHSSRFMCKMAYFFGNLNYFPTSFTTLLLINACLRLILTQQSQEQEQSWCQRCSKTLARVYCTPFASKIVTGTMLFSMCFFNVWALWAADIDQRHGYCGVRLSFSLIIWQIFTSTLLWIFPIIFLLPVLTMISWCIGRKRRYIQSFRINDEVSDMEFVRMTPWFFVVVCLYEFPMIILNVCIIKLGYSHWIILDLMRIFSLFHCISLCVLSSLWIFGLTSFRSEIRSRVPCSRWRRPTVAAPSTDGDVQEKGGNDDLHLDHVI